MVTQSEIARRYKNTREAMSKENLDALIVCGNEYTGFEGAIRYVSGFEIVHRYVYARDSARRRSHSRLPRRSPLDRRQKQALGPRTHLGRHPRQMDQRARHIKKMEARGRLWPRRGNGRPRLSRTHQGRVRNHQFRSRFRHGPRHQERRRTRRHPPQHENYRRRLLGHACEIRSGENGSGSHGPRRR